VQTLFLPSFLFGNAVVLLELGIPDHEDVGRLEALEVAVHVVQALRDGLDGDLQSSTAKMIGGMS
jgi:hypothetical protein